MIEDIINLAKGILYFSEPEVEVEEDGLETIIKIENLCYSLNNQLNVLDIYFYVGQGDCYDNSTLEEVTDNLYEQENIIIVAQYLSEKCNYKPTIEIDCDMCGTSFIVRFSDIPLNLEIIQLITNEIGNALDYLIFSNFKEILDVQNDLLLRGLSNYPEEAAFYEELKSNVAQKEIQHLAEFSNENGLFLLNQVITKNSPAINKLKDTKNVFINKDKCFLIGLAKEEPIIIDYIGKTLYEVENLYIGISFCLAKSSDTAIAVKSSYLHTFLELLSSLTISENISYFTDKETFLFCKGTEFWSIIYVIRNVEECILHEHKKLQELINDFSSFAPKKIQMQIDWSSISSSKFESLCQEFLEFKGFREPKLIGKTNASDGGRDIEAVESFETIVGSEKRKWIFQCKHITRSINKRDIANVRDLVDQYNVQAFGLICTSCITPQTIDFFNSLEMKGIKIKYWTGDELERELEKAPKLLTKYGIKIKLM